MSRLISRRQWLHVSAGLGLAAAAPLLLRAQAKTPVAVYKDASCGCCQLWVDHMAANGFNPSVMNSGMNAIKVQSKIPVSLQSCHTALVGGYVIEGHVPASDVRKLLAAKPKGIIGLTIPGMPASAPGMDGKPFEPYSVLTFDAQGRTTVYARHDKA